MPHTPRPVLGLVVAAILLVALAACGGGDDGTDAAAGSGEPTATASSSSPPGLEGVPDVVAEVNGQEVTRDEFAPFYQARLQQAAQEAQASGQAPDEDALREQTVDTLVDTELLAQEAQARGITVTEADVDAELSTLAEQYQLASAQELVGKLEEQGTSEDDVRLQVRMQAVIEKLVEDEAGAVAPTEQELRALYATGRKQAQQGGQEVPPYAKVRPQLEQQATAQRVGEVARTLVEELRTDADITVNLE